jgi:hypothetical protein
MITEPIASLAIIRTHTFAETRFEACQIFPIWYSILWTRFTHGERNLSAK